LLDLFLLSFTAVIALRLFGWLPAAVVFVMVILVHQEEPRLVWVILCVLLATIAMRAAPMGRMRLLANGVRVLSLAALLLVSVPFAVTHCVSHLSPACGPGGLFSMSD
jgi:hypothetical protein